MKQPLTPRFRLLLCLLAGILCALLSWSIVHAGEPRILHPGDRVDEPGIFLPAQDAIEAADMLDRFKNLTDQVKAADEQIKGLLAQVELLESMQANNEKELEIKDMVIKLKDEMLAFRKEMNDEWKALAAHNKEQLIEDRAAMERLQKMVDVANKRGFWSKGSGTILGALGMAALLAL